MKWFLLIVAALLVALEVAYRELRPHAPTVVGSPSVEYVPSPPPPAPPTPGVAWATYGYDAPRTRAVSGLGVRPPFRRLWTFHGRALLEFPPAVGYGSVYQSTFDGRLVALDAASGRAVWRYASGRCGWASPALAHGLVVVTFIGSGECRSRARDGEVVALDARTGRVRWLRHVAPTESSPLVSRGIVYVGDWSGRVSAFSLRDGSRRWSRDVGGAIKGSVAVAGRRLFIGTYGGDVLALGAATGHLLWARPTGGYVYASPAVWRHLVFVGSYDHRFYAFDAATGRARWSFVTGDRISGSASVVDGLVYFSTFDERTFVLHARDGAFVREWRDGKYSPVVASPGRLYFVGLGKLYALEPR